MYEEFIYEAVERAPLRKLAFEETFWKKNAKNTPYLF